MGSSFSEGLGFSEGFGGFSLKPPTGKKQQDLFSMYSPFIENPPKPSDPPKPSGDERQHEGHGGGANSSEKLHSNKRIMVSSANRRAQKRERLATTL